MKLKRVSRLVVVLLAGIFANAHASEPSLDIAAGARVGVMVLMPSRVTHFHASSDPSNSYMRTYMEKEAVELVSMNRIMDRLRGRGLTPVAVEAPAELRRDEDIPLNLKRVTISSEPARPASALAHFMPNKAPSAAAAPTPAEPRYTAANFSPELNNAFARIAAESNLDALVILAATYNNAQTREWVNRDWDLPEYVGGWGIYSREETGRAVRPVLFNLTQILLVRTAARQVYVVTRDWAGNDVMEWSDFHPAASTKLMPPEDLQKMWAQYVKVMDKHIDRVFTHLVVAGH